jgi:hypothetical protein
MGLLDDYTFNHFALEGRARLSPELATECERAYWERVYWAERTWGMSDEQVLRYLEEDNREKAHLIDCYPGGPDTVH